MAETKMQLVDWLDDLCVRFIINLPHEELTSVERICFQIEEAQWFYEDFIRAQDPQMPAMNLRRFCELIFQHCPLLAPFQASAALSYAEFLAYKTRVPVRGAIMLNDDMTEVVLVKGWNKKAKWSFPRGKINKEEKDLDCAIREVYEETGYDIEGAGLVDEDKHNIKYIDMSLREQQMRLYVFRDVPMDTYFEPKTRKEISKIDWFKVSELAATGNQKHVQQYGPVSQDALKSSQFYMVAPFIRPLRQWIKQQRKLDQQTGRKAHKPLADESEAEGLQVPNPMIYDDGMMTTDAEDESHFQRLLSGLQSAQQPAPEAVVMPEATAAASTADLSTQLKQMLSVGAPAAPVPLQQENNPLMSMLLGKSQAPAAHVPGTPMEQITSTPPQAYTPHHHHPRPPPYSEMPPPPAFPISPPQPQHGPFQPHSHHRMPLPPWQGHTAQPFHGQLPPMPPQHAGHYPPGQSLPGPQQRGLFGTNIPAPPPTQISNPLQTGDPAFRPHFSQYNPAPAPLPVPKPAPQKLTNHAMNLLNVFKSPDQPAAKPVRQVLQASPAQLPELADQSKPLLPSQLLGGAHNMPDRQPSPPQLHQPQAQKPRNAHQDSLLNLFRSSATPTAPRNQGLPLPAAEPIELSAQPSPHMPREIAKPVQHKLSMRRLPNVNTAVNLQKQSPHLTSATVSGPLNAPDFETVRKNQPQRPVELGNGIASPSPGTVPQAGFDPSTIMQRPSSGVHRQAAATPPVPIHTVTNTTAMKAPQPFHPTSILRRSAQDIAEMAQAVKSPAPAQPQLSAQLPPPPIQQQHHAQMPNFDRRDSAPSQHKDALLSLFGSPGPSAATKPDLAPSQRSPAEFPGSIPVSVLAPSHGRASGIGSPVSPLPSQLLLGAVRRQDTADSSPRHQHINETPRSSRISSLTSVPGEATVPALPGMGNTSIPGITPKNKPTPPVKRGSLISDAGGSGAQSPITPVEKNFLLGYLQEVVTKEGNARARQGGGGLR